MASVSGVDSVSGAESDAEEAGSGARAIRGPGHSHLKRPLVNPLKLRTDAAAYPNGTCCVCARSVARR